MSRAPAAALVNRPATRTSVVLLCSPCPFQYVALDAGTERAFTGQTVNGFSHDNKQKGVYVSAVGCAAPGTAQICSVLVC